MSSYREPRLKWQFEDNLLTGINAHTGNVTYGVEIILPYGLTNGQRDLVLWAFEAGLHQGEVKGQEKIQRDFRNLMRIRP